MTTATISPAPVRKTLTLKATPERAFEVFTARFGLGPGPVMFDKVCNDNGIRHLLTAPYSPTTTGKIERLQRRSGLSS